MCVLCVMREIGVYLLQSILLVSHDEYIAIFLHSNPEHFPGCFRYIQAYSRTRGMRGISINPRIKRDERRFMPPPAGRPGEGATSSSSIGRKQKHQLISRPDYPRVYTKHCVLPPHI